VSRFVHETLAWLDQRPGQHEVLVIDDGSTDSTGDRVRAIQDPRVHLIVHKQNRGMGAGMRSGILAATGDYFTILAADGQVPASALDTMLPELEDADLVLSVYSQRTEGMRRAIMSFGLRALMRLLLGVGFRLEGIYLFPVKVAVEDIGVERIRSHTFFFSFELIARALALGLRPATVTIEMRKREHGESKVDNVKQIKRVARELWRFRMELFREGTLRL
jgi:glycosyltransferase involved in cell wall biosynthesis